MLPRSLFEAEVTVGPVGLAIPHPELDLRAEREVRVRADRGAALLQLPGVATVGVQGGERVVVDPDPEVSPLLLAAWLLGTAAAFVLAQRGRFALHANLVEVQGRAVAIAGRRGAGKTTAALRLAQRGGRLLGDDLVALDRSDGGIVHTTTGRPLRLHPDTAAALRYDAAGAEAGMAPGGKLLVPQPASASGTLDRVVVLERGPTEAVETSRLTGAAALRAVRANAYRARLLERIWNTELFEWSAVVAAQVPVHVVRRPSTGWSADGVAAAVESLVG